MDEYTSLCKDNSFHSSESDSEPPSKKACGEKFRPLASKRKYSNGKELSWLVNDDVTDCAFRSVCK